MTASTPRWLLLPAALALGIVALPLLGMALRVPWPRLPALLATPAALDALRLSLLTCLASTALAVLLGYPLALVLSRARGRWAVAVRTLTVLPMVLPPVVGGLALLVTFGRRGLVGPALQLAGLEIGFTTLAVVLAQTFVAMPFFVVSVESALRTLDRGYEVVAATLGARPGTVLRRVTTPLLAPALIAGATLAFARSLGEFGATLTFAGSLQGTTRTMPLQIYLDRQSDTDAALALSLTLIAIATLLVVGGGAVGGLLSGGVPESRPLAASGRAAERT